MKLYYFEGIGYTDTPLFSSLEEQDLFFNELAIIDFNNVYYPPYFTNKIELPSNDVQYNELLDNKINYLSLEFKGKTYYYFIRNIDYTSEDVYSLDIEMDTIQTFMFDIDYSNAIVNRMLINRWNGQNINRDYIRENFSNDNFIVKDYIGYTDTEEYNTGFYVAKFPSQSKLGDGPAYSTTLVYNTNKNFRTYQVQDGSSMVIIPSGIITETLYNRYRTDRGISPHIIIEVFEDNQGIVTSKGTITLDFLHELIRKYSEDPSLIDFYFIPYNVFRDIKITTLVHERIKEHPITGERYPITELAIEYTYKTNGEDNSLIDVISNYHADLKINIAYVDMYSKYDYLPFNKQISTGQPFDYHNVPQLIDENYIVYEFGEKINRTQYPLSLTTNTTFSLNYGIDVSSGFRHYSIINNSVDLKDIYDTTIVVNTKELVPIYNDAWKTYAMQNMGSLTLGRLFNLGLGVAKGIKNPAHFVDVGSQVGDVLTQVTNKMFTPDTLTQGNTFTSDIINHSLEVIKIYKECTNIEDVAHIYESIGYKVQKYISGSPLDLNTRYYYNYYECNDINFSGHCGITKDIEYDIKNRWKNGLRFWTWHNEFHTFCGYWNKIGNVCYYDNVELNANE